MFCLFLDNGPIQTNGESWLLALHVSVPSNFKRDKFFFYSLSLKFIYIRRKKKLSKDCIKKKINHMMSSNP